MDEWFNPSFYVEYNDSSMPQLQRLSAVDIMAWMNNYISQFIWI